MLSSSLQSEEPYHLAEPRGVMFDKTIVRLLPRQSFS